MDKGGAVHMLNVSSIVTLSVHVVTCSHYIHIFFSHYRHKLNIRSTVPLYVATIIRLLKIISLFCKRAL